MNLAANLYMYMFYLLPKEKFSDFDIDSNFDLMLRVGIRL